jgi:hypothetical protein
MQESRVNHDHHHHHHAAVAAKPGAAMHWRMHITRKLA